MWLMEATLGWWSWFNVLRIICLVFIGFLLICTSNFFYFLLNNRLKKYNWSFFLIFTVNSILSKLSVFSISFFLMMANVLIFRFISETFMEDMASADGMPRFWKKHVDDIYYQEKWSQKYSRCWFCLFYSQRDFALILLRIPPFLILAIWSGYLSFSTYLLPNPTGKKFIFKMISWKTFHWRNTRSIKLSVNIIPSRYSWCCQ